jgi:hypothetical protein
MTIVENTSYDPVGSGQTGALVEITINNALASVYGCVRYEFTNEDLTAGVFRVTHGKGTKNVFASLKDQNYIEQPLGGSFQLDPTDPTNKWIFSTDSDITGTNYLTVDYRP